ncbi:MAG: thiamine-binding protein [Sediminibacterium sp.]|jgi:uncharacterized protein YqgV (UPF0045/DUF77 family)|nr:thiamine-binding protein [Sediminibacterium sp.]
MGTIIHAGFQLIPLQTIDPEYSLVNKAIEVIKASGLSFKITPFETVVAGSFEEVQALLSSIEQLTKEQSIIEWIIQLRLHGKLNTDLSLSLEV